ncbi:MAG: carbon monoxide dehydrogenase subunit G [Ktedonobacterales bacterium]
MHFSGEQTINAPMQAVWDYFMDPNKVAECAPGFKSMETLAPDHFKPTLAVGVGAVKATFTLDVRLADLQPTSHAAVEARGMAAGSAVDIRSVMDLTAESDTVTHLGWTADVNVSGTLASMGARLLEGTAHKMTARFFDCVRQKLEAPAAIPSPAPSPGGP